jgi:hypothetical protein
VVGGVVAGVRPRVAALGRQVEVVLAHARRPAARARRLLQEPCDERSGSLRSSLMLAGTVQSKTLPTSHKERKPFN